MTFGMAAAGLAGVPAWGASPSPPFNCAATQPYSFVNTTDVPIPDEGSASSSISVSGVAGTVYDVDLVTRIPHADSGDLAITLTGPSGKAIELSVGNGDLVADAFNGTTWDDGASPGGPGPADEALVTDHTYLPGQIATPLVPQEALASFAGDDPNGTWTLSVHDLRALEVGTIDEWSLRITTYQTAPGGASASSTGPGMTVPDGQTRVSTAQVARQGIRVNAVSVVLSDVSYSGFGDLTLTLTSPSGTVVTLTSGNGGTADLPSGPLAWRIPSGHFTGLGEPAPVTRVVFTQGFPVVLAPEESFGAFVGENPAGRWTLRVTDGGAIAGGGILTGWRLEVSGTACEGRLETHFEAAPAGTRIGTRAPYEVTVTNTGTGFAHSLMAQVMLAPAFRAHVTTGTPGGVCGAGTCSWFDPLSPGETRRMRVEVEYFYLGTFPASAVVRGITVPNEFRGPAQQSITETSPPLSVLPAARRAFNGRRCTVLGTPGNDDFRSYPVERKAQVYCGLGGNDRIVGQRFDDVFDGGPGNDIIRMGLGNDVASGGPGDDQLMGERGRDVLRGGPGRDRLNGGPGRDLLIGGPGRDFAVAQPGERLPGIERSVLIPPVGR